MIRFVATAFFEFLTAATGTNVVATHVHPEKHCLHGNRVTHSLRKVNQSSFNSKEIFTIRFCSCVNGYLSLMTHNRIFSIGAFLDSGFPRTPMPLCPIGTNKTFRIIRNAIPIRRNKPFNFVVHCGNTIKEPPELVKRFPLKDFTKRKACNRFRLRQLPDSPPPSETNNPNNDNHDPCCNRCGRPS